MNAGTAAADERRALLVTFDVEEFDLPLEWNVPLPLEEQLDVTRRGLARLLPLLERRGVCATFFATGTVAAHCPEMLRGLIERGHEVAAHGLAHGDDYGCLDAATAVARLREAREAVASASGVPVHGIRTPHLRPCPPERLRDAGYAYDASPHPTWVPTRYNGLHWPRRPWREAGVVRLPISVVPGVRLPVSFLWFRLAGPRLGRWAAAAASTGAPYLHLYFHPWEAIDVRPHGAPAWIATRTGDAFLAALDELLAWAAPRRRVCTAGEFAAGWCESARGTGLGARGA